MKVITEKDLPLKENTVATVGTFDGIHRAHQTIIEKLKRNKNLKSLIITFEPSPKIYFKLKTKACLITDLETKKYILGKLGIDYLYVINFNNNFIKISPLEFLKFLTQKLKVKKLIAGYDWKFGYKQQGDINFLKNYSKVLGYDIEILEPIIENKIRISSTKIRECLREGKVDNLKRYLNRDYFLRGKVVKGNQIGRKMGVPTINLAVDPDICLKRGVYAGLTDIKGKVYKSVINFGNRPTVDGINEFVEIHILDENVDIKDEIFINVIFKKFIREEIRFNSLDELKKQIKLDIITAKKILNLI